MEKEQKQELGWSITHPAFHHCEILLLCVTVYSGMQYKDLLVTEANGKEIEAYLKTATAFHRDDFDSSLLSASCKTLLHTLMETL